MAQIGNRTGSSRVRELHRLSALAQGVAAAQVQAASSAKATTAIAIEAVAQASGDIEVSLEAIRTRLDNADIP